MRNIATLIVTSFVFACLAGCNHAPAPSPDHPHLTPDIELRDITFHSAALNRDMPYRVILPKAIAAGQKLSVIYVLHGGGGGYRDWSNYSDIDAYAARGFLLVMPEGNSSYFMNSVDHPQDKYEDYIVHDLIVDVEQRFPVAAGREHRAIVLSFHHPEKFAFAAGLSPALDVPTRPFSMKRIGQWRDHRSIFGAWNGALQAAEDPYRLAKSLDPLAAPHVFFRCGDREGLYPANQRFSQELETRHFAHAFHVVKNAGHEWRQWSEQVPAMMQALGDRVH